MTASSSSWNTLNTNIMGDCNVNIDNKGDGSRTHIGHDNRANQGVVVTGGSAYISMHGESSDVLNELLRAPAYYDSSLRKQAQQCMQDTRVAILNTIYEWKDSLDSPPIFWLHGPAGTGKSTIAHTVAEECRRRKRLGASFFFAHANAECSDPSLFFSTLAYQLSTFVPDLRRHIIDGVKGHPSPQDASISTQFEEFILTPMRKLSNSPAQEPIIVVVDAFDECSDAQLATEILQLLSAKIPSFPHRFKFFITSRPEPEIRSIFHPDIARTVSRSFDLLRDVAISSTDEDIKRFLRVHLCRIGKEYYLPSWPREMDIEDLAQQAGGLFVFAETAIELVRDKDVKDPESQLAMLKCIGTTGTPALNVNALYSRILQKAIPETASTAVHERVISIINAIVGLRAPLALCALERFLGLDRGAIRAALDQLHSIFIVPDNDEDTVQVIHPAFARYIADEESCTEKIFVVGGRKLHNQLAKHCLKQMKAHLKQNICNFKDFTTVEAPIKDEESSDVDLRTLSEELKYSCENFAAHVSSADWQDSELCEMVAEWANQCLLYWLELLALIGSFRDALSSLRLLTKFCEMQTSKDRSKILKWLKGRQATLPKFFKARTAPPEQGPQLKESTPSSKFFKALTAAPEQGPQLKESTPSSKFFKARTAPPEQDPQLKESMPSSKFFKARTAPPEQGHHLKESTPSPKFFKALTAAPEQDPQLKESLQLLTDAIRMVSESYDDIKRFPHQIYASFLTFCPLDSTLFKQYSQLSTVRVLSGKRQHWRPLLHAFKDPDGDVISLTFSPDRMILASCSSAGKILLWNLDTRESRVLACHTLRRDTAFTFSPDGKYVAADGNVYRVTTGEEVLTPGICSAFSPDGLYIALGCDDGIIRLYDMQASKLSLFGELSGHGGAVTTLAFSSDNKFLTSASSDDTIRVWNCSSWEMMKQTPCREPSGYTTFSPDGTYVAAHYESFVRGKGFETYVWVADIQTGKEKSIEVAGELDQFYSAGLTLTTTILSSSGDYVAFFYNGALHVVRQADSARLAAGLSGSKGVRWVAETEKYLGLKREFGSAITSISFMPDGQRLLVGNEEGLIKSWRIPKQSVDKVNFECKAHFGAVQAIAFSHDAKFFASASIDGSICVWDSTSVDLHERELTRTSAPHRQTVTFAPDGQAVAIDTGNTISKVDAATGRSTFEKKNGLYCRRDSLIFSADGKYLASGGSQELLVWDTGSASCKWGRHIATHTFSPDATYYAMLFSTGHLWIHDLRNGESRKVVSTNRRAAFSEIKFSHDSKHIASLHGEFCMFDVEKGVQTDLDFPAKRNLTSFAFSPCSQHIAIAHDSGLDVLEYLAKEPNAREVHRKDGYQSVEFSPDGKYLLASGRPDPEDRLDLFHPDTLEILYTINLWSKHHIYHALREFRRTGRLLNHPLFQPSEYENLPYLLDKDGWVITSKSKRLCRLPVANLGMNYDVNGNRIAVVSPEGKVTLIQLGPDPVSSPTPP